MKKCCTAFKSDENVVRVKVVAVDELTLEEARKSWPVPKQDAKAIRKKVEDAMKRNKMPF